MVSELIKNWGTKELVVFLREQKDLKLDFEDLRLICEEKLVGNTFLCLTQERLKACGFKWGPIFTILDLIKNINTNNFTIPVISDDIPSFKEIKTWQHPTAKYFEIYPYEIWSLKHFVSWAIENKFDKETSHQTFYKALQTINKDQKASSEFCNFIQKLLDNKRYDLPAVCELWNNVATVSIVNEAVDVVKAHMNLDNVTNLRVEQLVLPKKTDLEQPTLSEITKGKKREQICLGDDNDQILKKAKITSIIDVPILNVESLEGTTTTFRVVAENETETNKKAIIPHCNPSFIGFRSEVGMLFADKTIYIEKLEEEGSRFRILLLRPRRFGKSAFLDMLCQYYDIKNADKFSQLFGPLYIGKHPTNSQNKYLVLKFDLSLINVHSYEKMEKSFNENINCVLRDFVEKYDEELGHPDIDKLIVEQGSISLQKIMSIVKRQSQKLFIGVDEYDTPGNNIAFKHEVNTLNHEERNYIDEVEQFFNTNFFAVLKKECCSGPIDKLYVTGVAPAFRTGLSPLLILEDISERPQFYGICGFTEEEVQSIVTCYFDNDPKTVNDIMEQIKLLYFGHNFVNAGSNAQTLFVYNIHLIFHYLRERRSRDFVFDTSEPAAVNSTKILTCIADQSPVSIDDLLKLLTNGKVSTKLQNNFNYSDLLRTGGQDVEYHQRLIWSLLYYFGILTRNYDGSLKIPNQVTRTEVITRIADYTSSNKDLFQHRFSAYSQLIRGSVNPLIELTKNFFKSRPTISLRTANEAVMQVIFEVLLPTSLRVSELRLIVDGTKKSGDGRFGFVDLFVLENGSEPFISNVVLELKYITISGLLSGKKGSWIKNPDVNIMDQLDKDLEKENEEQLLQRKYMYWSKDEKKFVQQYLNKIWNDGYQQLVRYINTIKKGMVKRFDDSGILDSRIIAEKGSSQLRGYLIMSVGSCRTLIRSHEPVTTEFKYKMLQG